MQGDTESAFQGALAGFSHGLPVLHVEAGLRTYNLRRPFPEEGLRQMISRISRLHFAPTLRAAQALEREGIASRDILVTGNTVVDAQLWVCERHHIRRRVQGRGHILVTMHRRENWGPDIDNVCAAIADIAREFPWMTVLFPVHLNPVVRDPVHRHLGALPNVRLTAPLDYLAMHRRSPMPGCCSRTRVVCRKRRRPSRCRCWYCVKKPSGRRSSMRAAPRWLGPTAS